MRHRSLVSVLCVPIVSLALGGCPACTKPREGAVRKPAVAGAFYPADPLELRGMVQGFLGRAKKTDLDGDLIALLAPHAGYVYSGLVAAHSYKVLEGTRWDTVVIIGASHRPSPHVHTGGFGIVPGGSFETPLGRVEIDAQAVRALMKREGGPAVGGSFSPDSSSHLLEHSIETQLPFLQVVLKEFKILPILVGKAKYSDLEEGASAIAGALRGKKALLIASSDLSHYPADDDARREDARVLSALGSLNPRQFSDACSLSVRRGAPGLEVAACGEDAVLLTLLTAAMMGANRTSLLAYGTSYDSGGEKHRVVGYGAMAFFRGRTGAFEPIGPEGRKALLSLARKTLIFSLNGKEVPSLKPGEEVLSKPFGVFVTLRKAGRLRGCVGNITGGAPLYEAVQQMAVAAATQDPRFPPVTGDELKDIGIEISVLSLLRQVRDVGEVSLGTHGVAIRKGTRSGLFLPQVAAETGWDLLQFLNELCTRKAGLKPECWKEKGTEVSTFTAQVFEEE